MADRPNSGFVDWRVRQQEFMPLSVAAAIALHQAQRGAKAIQSAQDYIAALDIAASALSQLIPIYAFDAVSHTRVAVDADPAEGEFAAGATEFQYHNRSKLTPLSVLRGDLISALSFMRRFGPALAFAASKAPRQEGTTAPEPAAEQKSQPSH